MTGQVRRIAAEGGSSAAAVVSLRPAMSWLDRAALSGAFLARWDALFARASEPNVFAAPWMLPAALEHCDPAGGARIIAVWSGGAGVSDLIGLMPLAREPRYGRRPVPHWQNWLHSNAFLGTPLVAQGQERAFWQAILSALDGAGGRGLFLHLNGLHLGGPVAAALKDVAARERRRHAVVARHDRALLQWGQSPEAYLATALRGKKRKELRRQRARLADLGVLETVRSDGASDLDAWIEDFLALEASGWKGARGSALASQPATERLLRATLHGAARAGALDLIALTLDKRPIAMLVTLLAPPGAFSFKTAFDESLARFSPGVLLQIDNLAMLGRNDIGWADSCAAPDHSMIDGLWLNRRSIGRVSVAIGGPVRRAAFALFNRGETMRARLRGER